MAVVPLSAFAASYNSTFQVYSSSGFDGPARSYNGDITIKTYEKKVSSGTDKKDIKIELYRVRTFVDDYVGSVTHHRLADDTSTFTNVGAGSYYFHFSKSDDGVNVTGKVNMHD